MPVSPALSLVRRSRGRPHKFGRPSRAVTVTLPEDVLTRLASLDADLGRAIVGLVERRSEARASASPAPRPAELASYGRRGVIVVNPSKVVRDLPGVQLVPVGEGRALISLAPAHSIATLELAVRDARDRPGLAESDRHALDTIAEILGGARRSPGVALEARTIIVLETKRGRVRR